MKTKIFPLLLMLALLFTCLVAPATAAGQPTVEIGNVAVQKAGQNVTLRITLKNCELLTGAEIYVGYDNKVMSFVSAASATTALHVTATDKEGANPVKLLVADLTLKGVSGDIAIADLTFSVSAGTAVGNYYVGVSVAEAFDCNLKPIHFSSDTFGVLTVGDGGTHKHDLSSSAMASDGKLAGYTQYTCTCGHAFRSAFRYTEATVVKMTVNSKTAYVNGEAKTLDAEPIIRQSRTMLPVRFVAENLGAAVGWDGNTSTATVTGNGVVIEITIGATAAKVNGESVALDSPAFVENSRTYLPVRFVAEKLGATVDWDGATSTATLTK